MASIINKRQQARNERVLQDLIKNVAGNDRCADCEARNPGWASWSLGIFLCMRCAAIHRKLGVHISKVKSLSMDSWSNEQVDHMKKVGNTASNRIHNPRNVKPNLPLDADMIDTAMEKFIRSKYQTKTISQPAANMNRGSTSSDDNPPPVPAKNTPRFGAAVRAASSTYPMPAMDRPLPPTSGSNGIGSLSEEQKLAQLKAMGFSSEKKNAAILKGVNGDVNKAIDSLIRLGEGGHASETIRNQAPPQQRPAGAQVVSAPSTKATTVTTETQLPQPPMRADSGNRENAASPSKSWNPFDTSTQQNTAIQAPTFQPVNPLENAFQNLNISPQYGQPAHQALFPHNTGLIQAPQQQYHNNPFLRTFTPPITTSQYQYVQQPFPSFSQQVQSQIPQSQSAVETNPFLRSSRSQNFTLSNSLDSPPSNQPSDLNQQQPMASSMAFQWPQSPAHSNFSQSQYVQYAQASSQQNQVLQYYGQQQQQQQQPQQTISSFPVQSPQSYVGQQSNEYPFPPLHSQQQPQHQTQTPQFFQDQTSQSPMQYAASPTNVYTTSQFPQQQQFVALPSSGQFQQRYDKSSILALFNNQQQAQPGSSPANPTSMPQQVQRSVSMPLATSASGQNGNATISNNPFGPVARAMSPHKPYGGLGHIREESREFTAFNGNGNTNGNLRGNEAASGRYSPDAFAGLSARYG